MKICITGGAGFVGSNIAGRLKGDHQVTIVDDLSFGSIENTHAGVHNKIRGFETLDKLDHYDLLIHCACANIIYAQDHIIETFKINTQYTIELFKRFKGPIIYTSTASVYGQADMFPTPEAAPQKTYNAYDQSKYAAELALQIRGNYTTLRLSNVYGINQRPDNPYSGVISKFIDAAIKGEPMQIYGDGHDTRDYTYITDVVDAVEQIIKHGPYNDTFNISGGEEVSSEQLAAYICFLMDKPMLVEYVERRGIDAITRRWLDSRKAKKIISWEPSVKLKYGLKNTIEWIKNNFYLD